MAFVVKCLTPMGFQFVIWLILISSSFAYSKTTYVLGVDGLSLEALQEGRKNGLFKELNFVSGHISTFPSMTDLAWSEVFQTREVFGKPGKIHSVEAIFFDESAKKIKGDVRDYYLRLAQPKYYMNGFEFLFNPYVEALMYFPTKEMAKLEVKSVIDGMLGANSKSVVTGYIGGVDSTAHTQINRLHPVLLDLNEGIVRLVNTLKKRGDDFELFVISDHGNVGRFQEGEEEVALEAIEIAPVLKEKDLNLVAKLQKPGDVAMPLMALGTWAPVYVYDQEQVKDVIEAVKPYEWFDMAFQLLENSSRQVALNVAAARGDALVIFDHKTKQYFYQTVTGNPLHFPQSMISTSVRRIPLTVKTIEQVTRGGDYPDSLIRLVKAVTADNFDFPDLILTFKDGFFLNSSLGSITRMYRTHGSLSRRSSLGVFASVLTKLPDYIRSEEIFPAMGIQPGQTFGQLGQDARASTKEIIKNSMKNRSGIQTGARDYSEKKIFKMITKPVSLSRPFFVVDEIKDLMTAFNINLSGEGDGQRFGIGHPDYKKFDFANAVRPEEIGELTDLAIKNPDINFLKNHPQVKNLVERLGVSDTAAVDAQQGKTLGAKRLAMKVYQIPYLLDQASNFQEKTALVESRDLKFADYWNDNRDKIRVLTRTIEKPSGNGFHWDFWRKREGEDTLAQRLFKEIFKETEIAEKIAPQDLTEIYRKLPENSTIVYVPGTYNGIFDEEIFSLGMLAVKDDLGLRTLMAPIKSACSSDVNADILLKFLKEDQRKFISRKQKPPRYILIGYSKGALDSLFAFVQDKKFVQESIQGLVAVASPLKGSPILGKADLPFIVVNMLIDESTPEVCKSEKIATSTGTVQAVNRFWKKNERDLVGLTRYFSVSFVSEPEESHIIMKATKLITQFDEENDGIIPLSSSKFPKSLKAIDLGTLRADHLAGVLSSKFNQRAFMKALVKTLAELGIENEQVSSQWRLQSLLPVIQQTYQTTHAIVVDPSTQKLKMHDFRSRNFTAQIAVLPYRDPYDLNTKLLFGKKDPIAEYEPRGNLTMNQIDFELESSLDLAKMPDVLSSKKVAPAQIQYYKQGLDLSFNHQYVRHYRIDHQWFYESRSPIGADNNPKWGFQAIKGQDGQQWLALRSEKNSVRLTTLSHRFRPVEFPRLELSLQVTKGPVGADPVLGKSGKDDSSFQLWVTFRDLRKVKDRNLGEKSDGKVYTFGYYWGEEVPGEKRKAGEIFENTYSNKNVVVAQLPAAFQMVLNSGKDTLGQALTYKQNLVVDLKRAYPQIPVESMEIIAITLQMDSNDTGSSSEAFMKTLKFMPD